MEHLINSNILLKRNNLIKCLNEVNSCSYLIQKRDSRASVAKYKFMAELRRQQIVPDKSTAEDLVSIEHCSKVPRVSNDHKKTSITVDILGKETLPKLTNWRKLELIKRARRILPLPTSLTGFGDGNMPKYWAQKMSKTLFNLSRIQQNQEINMYEKLTPSQRLFIETNAEKVSQKSPQLIENYFNSKVELMTKTKKEETSVLKKPLKFPYELKSFIKENKSVSNNDDKKDDKDVGSVPHFNSGLIDTEYENYLKHHRVTQYLAKGIAFGRGMRQDKYEDEIKAWSAELWRRNYGTPDPSIEPSNIACSGCGAFLHCTDTNIPGYMPSEKFVSLTEDQLRLEQCQRCQYLLHFNVALNVNVSADEYPKLIAQMQNNAGIAIIMVDILDFPCSIWPGIVELIGENNRIFFVANKVDLLPKDDELYLERVLECFRNALLEIGVERRIVYRNVCLLSAKTGWGVENLITKLYRLHNRGENIYLIGCTNVGKSTLFNALMQSDLCKFRNCDLMCRATTSIWPGTTLNLIKFPIMEPTGYDLQLRLNRLEVVERHDIAERQLKMSLRKENVGYTTLSSRIGTTFRSEVPFTFQSGHPFAKKSSNPVPFNPESAYFRDCGFFHDTPGSIYKDQILNLLTTEELLKTVPRELITPRTFSLKPLQSIFIGGLARIDLLHARQHVWFTVFASHYLPIHVVFTEQANQFYYTYLGTDMLGVPIGDDERIKHWPLFVPKEIKLDGVNWTESCADVVLSTAGWVAITTGPDTHCVLKAFTPEGRGIHVRTPPLLACAFKLRGKKILGTPCFENKLYTIDDMVNGAIPKSWQNCREANITEERFKKIFKN